MALQATVISDRRYIKHVLTAAANAGDIVQAADTRPGVVLGAGSYAIGETVTLDTEATIEAATASGTTFSAGDPIEWDDTNNVCVAATAGDFDLGRALKAKVSGELVTLVTMNTTNF